MRKQSAIILFLTMGCIVGFLLTLVYLEKDRYNHHSVPFNYEKYGNPQGRDFVDYAGDGTYQIVHIGYNSLVFCEDENYGRFILEHEHERLYDKNDTLFFYSADGCAVVYAKSNLCKVYIMSPPLKLVQGEDPKITGRTPNNNYQIRRLYGDEYSSVVYLDSFEEYTPYEQKVLTKLIRRQQKFDKVANVIDRIASFLGILD